MYYSELNESMLTDIILCDPITTKGRRALARLGLESIIVHRNFFSKYYAVSRFEKEFEREVPDETEEGEREFIFRKDKYNRIKDNINNFEKRISGEVPNQTPLVVMGVAGNGKSVEVYRLVHNACISSNTATNILVKQYKPPSGAWET
ncbi:MAG: hypothetical protein Q4A32_04830 [Lachnospiraceae bacterium]|nr:hypothetical protein [Lachnospiraceae bacterium]